MEIFQKVKNIFKLKIFYAFMGLLMLLIGNVCFAETVVIQPRTPISISKTYHNVTLDMSKGSFIITDGAVLTIRNCTIKGKLTKDNPILFSVDEGKLVMRSNNVKIKTFGIIPHPEQQSLYYVMQIAKGTVDLNSNKFSIDKPFSAGFLITLYSYGTTDFTITNNRFKNFHGVLYLINSGNALVQDNVFVQNSYGNIVNMGNKNKIIHNTIYFSGNDRLGNAIDILNSNDVLVSRNLLLTPTCHGIYILSSQNLILDANRIMGGITYAIYIISFPEVSAQTAYLAQIIPLDKIKMPLSGSIAITNNFMSQNRYGVAATDVDGLTVDGNFFIQRFEDAAARKFWTDNNVLLKNVTGLVWTNNFYKEAYTQDIGGDNSKSNVLVPFPASGGVVL